MEAAAETTGSAQRQEVRILVNNKEVLVPKVTTGTGIKEAAGVPADYQVFRIKGHEEIPVGNDERIEVHEHERFAATPSIEPA